MNYEKNYKEKDQYEFMAAIEDLYQPEGSKPKWHKVADGDLPKACEDGTNTSKHVLVQFKSGNTGVCYYDWDLLGWFANGYPEQLKNILAWCEMLEIEEW